MKTISIVLVNLLIFAGCSSYYNPSNTISENLMTLVEETSWPTDSIIASTKMLF